MFVLALAWVLAGMLAQTKAPATTTSPLRTERVAPDPGNVTRNLLGMTPFGEMRQRKQTPPNKIRAAVPSHLPIILRGTVMAGADSVAVIEPRPGVKPDIFHIGDSILPGVVLRRVENRRILIESNGRLEMIMLMGAGMDGMPVPGSSGGVKMSAGGKRVSRSMLDRELKDFPRLLTQARVLPAMLGGKSAGFRISEIVPGSLYARIGMKNGDVVQAVNNIRIQSPEQAMRVYRQLKDAPRIEVRLLRNGQVRTLSYNIQ